ncbi:Uncharacterised protein [Streptococcus pseudoporcinus]|uniref:Uncharacterized protein n=1 Tax=Streptococcus pseudoporcinus TaxID=361101 RepID=A0A4U9Z1K4_9STRE|nr:Uncharacterised protein [Streptococcus pseudoporcinus]
MTKEKMRVLQIGHHNWSELFTIPEAIDYMVYQPTISYHSLTKKGNLLLLSR